MSKVIPTVSVVVFDGRRVLLVVKKNHPKKLLQLPGGQIEDGESEIDAARRELTENTSLAASSLTRIPGTWQARIRKDYGEALFEMTCYLANTYSGRPIGTEIAEPVWVHVSELSKLPLNPNTAEAVKAALKLVPAT